MKPIQRGQLEIHPELNEIAGPAGRQRIEPQAVAVLALLAGEPGKIWSRETLLDEAWGERVVSDATLTGVISRLRAALSAAGIADVRIETRSKRGYRLVVAESAGKSRNSRRRVAALTTILAVALAVMLTGWQYLADYGQQAHSANDPILAEFTIVLPDGGVLEPIMTMSPGSDGRVLVGNDASMLRLDLRVVPLDDGMVRIVCEIFAITEWGQFELITAHGEINRFSMPAAEGRYEISLRTSVAPPMQEN